MSETRGFRLSPQQARLWRQQQAAGGRAFVARAAIEVAGSPGGAALERALAAVVARTEILRTRFRSAPGMALPLQVIEEAARAEWSHRDLAALPAAERQAAVERAWEAAGRRPLDLAAGAPLVVDRLTLAPDHDLLVVALPALAADEETCAALVGELAAALAGDHSLELAGEQMPPLAGEYSLDTLQYADLAEWQHELLEADETAEGRQHWRSLDLPSPPPAASRRRDEAAGGSAAPFAPAGLTVPVPAADAVAAAARALGVEADDLLLAAWAALLGRLHELDRVVLGRRFDGRRYEELAGALGPLARLLPVVVDVPARRPFALVAAEAAERVREAGARQEFADWEHLPLPAAAGDEPTWLPYAAAAATAAAAAGGGARLRLVRVAAPVDRFGVEVRLARGGDAIELAFDGERWSSAEARRLGERLAALLAAAAATPQAALEDLESLAPGERHRLLVEVNATAEEPPMAASIHALVAEQAARTPGAEALRSAAGSWTHGELAAAAAAVAAELARRGVGPETRVAVLLPRSRRLVAALLGVLEAGAAYVPLDPEYPAARLSFVLADCAAALVVTTGELAALVPAGAAPVLLVEEVPPSPPPRTLPEVSGESLAYVLYTSGSTGRPKGVMVSHRAAVDYLEWARRQYARPGERVPVHSSVAFDLTVTALFAPLAAGGIVELLPEDSPVEALAASLAAGEPVAFVKLTPAHLEALGRLYAARGERPPASRVGALVLGGEQLLADALDGWRLPGGPRLINEYGPTEATVGCSVHTVAPGDPTTGPVPIGLPLPNARLYVVDRRLRLLPEGMAGELVVAGVGLARGYLGRPGRTAESFVPDPFGPPGTRLYRTGDRARWRPGGPLELLGRIDRQVKLRGFRIEPGEVEAALRRQPAVAEAVVDLVAGDVEPRLAAWLVLAPGASLDPAALDAALDEALAAELPRYMVPAAYVSLPALPLTVHGKVDRAALPPPGRRDGADAWAPPENDLEERLAALWAASLGVERVGRHDNFFTLGGDSILGIELVGAAARQGLRFTARQLFRFQTLAALAEHVERVEEAPPAAAAAAGTADDVPLAPLQRWFFDLDPRVPRHFNQAQLLAVGEQVPTADLVRAVAAVAASHPALRLRFERVDGRWRQRLAAREASKVAVVDLSALPGAAADAARTAVGTALQASLDLARGPLWRAALFLGAGGGDRSDGGGRQLLLVAHHLVIDTVSWRVLGEEIEQALAALRDGRPPEPAPEPVGFAAWSRRLAEWALGDEAAAEARHWIDLPWHRARSLPGEPREGRVDEGEEAVTTLEPAAATALLTAAAASYRARADEVLLTALAGAVSGWTGGEALAVAVEGHGRDAVAGLDAGRTVGWLATLYPVLVDLGGLAVGKGPGADLGEALLRVRQALGAVPGGGRAWGAVQAAGAGDAAAALAALPLPEVLLNYHGRLHRGAGGGALVPARGDVGPRVPGRERRPWPLEVNAAVETDGGLRVIWSWDGRRFDRAEVEGVVERFGELLAALAEHCRSPAAGGSVPADFPLAGLDERELAGLLGARRDVEDVLPLTPAQQGILYETLASPRAGAYFDQVSCTLDGPLDAAALRRAWERAVERHAALRTSFRDTPGGEVRAVVVRRVEVPWEEVDLSAAGPAEQEGRLAALAAADRRRGFDLAAPPLLRLVLVRLAPRRHRFLWSSHHLLLDGWSTAAVLEEVFHLYRAEVAGGVAELPVRRPFRDYLAWLAGRDGGEARRYWQRALAGAAPTPLPVVRPPGGVVEAIAQAVCERRLEAPVDAALTAFGRARGLTPATLVQGAWALLLHRYSGRDDVVFGTVAAGRPPELAGSDRIVGMLIHVLPVRVAVEASAPAADWLAGLQESQAEARQHDAAPLAEVQRWAGLDGRRPLFESLVVFQNYRAEVGWLESSRDEHGLELSDFAYAERTSYPLTLVAVDAEDGLLLRLLRDPQRVSEEAAKRIVDHVATLLAGIAAAPRTPLAALPLLTAAESRQLAAWNDTSRRWSDAAPVHEQVVARAAATPDAVAVSCGSLHLTYGSLERLSRRLAGDLRAAGVGAEAVVAVAAERTPEMVVAILAALRAGAAWAPVDPEHPAARNAALLEDAAPAAVLATPAALERLQEVLAALPPGLAEALPVLAVDLRRLATAAEPAAARPFEPSAAEGGERAAYVLFTSGSTGRPKGAVNTHHGLDNRLRWMQDAYALTAGDRVAQKTPFTFDVSVWELLWPLAAGAHLVLARPGGHRDPAWLARWLTDEAVTVCHFVPSMLRAFLDQPAAAGCTALRQVVASGEALAPELVGRFAAVLPGAHLDNLYGPTEAAIDVTVHRCDARADAAGVPIGRPIANLAIHLLDAAGRQVPVGVPAELAIGGAGLARGYRRRPGLTAERFVPHPLTERPGERLYRTGDLARRREDGEIEFLGRLDDQVKVRGVRVEPGEVEAALAAHPAVAAAAVLPRRVGDDVRLAAYVVPAAGAAPAPAELRDFLRHRVHEAMVPADWMLLDALPVTANGKLDRKALAAAAPSPATAPAGAPAGAPVAEILGGIWAEVLGLPEVGGDDDFLDLGGHSLSAVQVASRVRSAFGVELPVAEVLAGGRLREAAAALEGRLGSATPAEPLVASPRRPDDPLSFAQQRLWMEAQLAPGSAAYNLPAAPRLTGRLAAAAYEQAAGEVVRRHEVLRSRFPVVAGRPVTAVEPPRRLELPVVDLSRLAAAARPAERDRLLAAEARRPFDLARGPLFRARLLRLGPDDHHAAITLHHIVTDGWSRGILAGELEELRAVFAAGRPSPLAELPVQYADFALWQRRHLDEGALAAHLEHFRGRLAPPLPELALGSAAVTAGTGGAAEAAGAGVDVALPAALTAPLRRLARREGATLYMTLLAAFAVLLYRLTGQDDLVIGSAVAGRTHRETEGLIGFFVNMVALRLDLAGGPRFDEVVRRVRSEALAAYAHQDLPFEKLAEALRPAQADRARPLLDVAFGFDETPGAAAAGAAPAWEAWDVGHGEARFPLTVWVSERDGVLVASWTYRTGRFDAGEVRSMAAAWEALLGALVARPEARIEAVELVGEEERLRREEEERRRREAKTEALRGFRRNTVSQTASRRTR